jgi:hypothetical protein
LEIMNTHDLTRTLTTLFGELLNGASVEGAYVLNGGDQGLLASLDRLPAAAASAQRAGGASVAAHVEHLRYGLSLMNRWAARESPFADANWATSWERTTVSESEWAALRLALEAEAERWLTALGTARDVDGIELNGMIASIVHLAYHVGAIRQIDRALRGPAAND